MPQDRAFTRPQLGLLAARLGEPRRFLQAIVGPRQTGKTTLALQAAELFKGPVHRASADLAVPEDRAWIETQWQTARAHARLANGNGLLILDEVQKVPRWSSVVKAFWDEDTARGAGLKVLLLGSSPMLMQAGLTESLAGRFEVIRVPHWSLAEMRQAFNFTLEQFLFYGGYPGAAALIGDESRWRSYVNDSLIETTVSRDILLMTRVDKPALLRRLFSLACEYSGQILSYQKMLGQLQDAGNTTTLAHYLDLLHGAGFVTGLQKYAGRTPRQRGSSPKLQVLNTALMNALQSLSFAEARERHQHWGRIVESAVGAHLLNQLAGTPWTVQYWNESATEVDFVVTNGEKLIGVEVKSEGMSGGLPGLTAFSKHFPEAKPLLVGDNGIPIEQFLSGNVMDYLQ